MDNLKRLINRFQDLQRLTGRSKSTSYSVEIYFSPDVNKEVVVTLGGYDIGDWARQESVKTTRENLLPDLELKVIEAEETVKREIEEKCELYATDLDNYEYGTPKMHTCEENFVATQPREDFDRGAIIESVVADIMKPKRRLGKGRTKGRK